MPSLRRVLALCAALSWLCVLPAHADEVRAVKSHGSTKLVKKPAKKVRAPRKDWDRDGLNNRYERLAGTRPRRADSDRDGVADGAEDRDGDGVSNRTEQLARTRPGRADSDRDGVADGAEDLDGDGLDNRGESVTGNHPRRRDSDGDGVRDGDEHAGFVSSVDGDLVTLALLSGGTLVGRVDEDSDVFCLADEDDADLGDDEDFEDFEDDEDYGDDDELLADDEEDFEDDGQLRSARSASVCLAVGAPVYQADIELIDGLVTFVALDLVGD